MRELDWTYQCLEEYMRFGDAFPAIRAEHVEQCIQNVLQVLHKTDI